ncbi:hypothetical protein FRB99_009051 [Tulasnella sp. 403]|nr:hypothetical protein FRB99_009051 [Tulasnella sp. 403]
MGHRHLPGKPRLWDSHKHVPIRGVFRASVAAFLWHVLAKIPIEAWKPIVDCDSKVGACVIRARDAIFQRDRHLSERLTSGELDMGGETDEWLPLIHRLMRQQVKVKAEDHLSDRDIISEAMGQTITGVDTSATALSYMMYTLALRPDMLVKLRAESDPLMPTMDKVASVPLQISKSLTSCLTLSASSKNLRPPKRVFLHQCIANRGRVALRLCGSGPSFLERVVPKSLNGLFNVKGYTISAGTVVNTQAWSVHRHDEVFPNPYAFKPEPWLDETEEMRSGGRFCRGMNLAHCMLRIALVATIRNFNIVIPPETTAGSMCLGPLTHQTKDAVRSRCFPRVD